MNLAGLDFDNIPSFSVPMRFFFVAPVFAFISALIIAVAGESMWLTRWHPATLAVTHAIVLGVISMIMCGSILQLLPVLAGKSLPKVKLISTLTVSLMTVGTLSLIRAFLANMLVLGLDSSNSNFFFAVSGISFTLGLGGFICAILWLIRQRSQACVSINTMRLGFIAMLVVGIIASLLLAGYLFASQFNITKQLTDSHASWGLIGWISLIIIGVSFQVLPMFHVAPAFPSWCSRYLPGFLFITLLIYTLMTLVITQSAVIDSVVMESIVDSAVWQLIQTISIALLQLSLMVYAVTAMYCLYRRKRKINDASVTCWFIALTCLFLCCAMSFVMSLMSNSQASVEAGLLSFGWSPLTLASVFIYGWILSVIMAMIIKIVPFLAYLHLQRQCGFHLQAFALLPNMHELLSKSRMQYLLYCHVFSLFALIITLYNPEYYWLLSSAIVGQFGYLLVLMAKVSSRYHHIAKAIDEALLT
ncbi:hypothetical protein [Moritella sp. F3]|uniref:hypothetical protein n=1 Tax=Moritella sp. F3 TaxID=2718882 RepID=UPI0018E191BF|nr:hypothetical protein [Moritella sp. F3]GIC78191.1 hypothetical protein FMO001_29180 [Moritella sp. F1]GIC81165.1 hypothetical protein FMO003_14460 [Moritella sp. F3]